MKLIEFPRITRYEIWDRSKADRLAKGLAFLQAGWLLIHVIARLTHRLPLTPFEVSTAAFIIPTLATSYFWSSKPQNVAEPTVIKVGWTHFSRGRRQGAVCGYPSRLCREARLGRLAATPLAATLRPPGEATVGPNPNDYSLPPPTGAGATVVWIMSVAHAMIHLTSWSYEFPTETERIIWRISSVALLTVMVIGGLIPVLSTRP